MIHKERKVTANIYRQHVQLGRFNVPVLTHHEVETKVSIRLWKLNVSIGTNIEIVEIQRRQNGL